jgi:hypothetical protein
MQLMYQAIRAFVRAFIRETFCLTFLAAFWGHVILKQP